MKRAILYLFFTTIILNGCSLSSIQLDSKNIRLVKREAIESYIGNDITIDWINSRSNDDFIIVDITTTESLKDVANENDIAIGVDSYFCDTPDSVAPISTGGLYIHGQPFDIYRFNNQPSALTFTNGYYKYNIVLFISFEKDVNLQEVFRNDKKQALYQKFNLRENPQDICIYITGSGLISSYKSNIVKLKKEDIRRVLNPS